MSSFSAFGALPGGGTIEFSKALPEDAGPADRDLRPRARRAGDGRTDLGGDPLPDRRHSGGGHGRRALAGALEGKGGEAAGAPLRALLQIGAPALGALLPSRSPSPAA